ncbi:MAG: hypothetical protein ABI134_17465 [Byssovorax sp.]
MATSPTSVIAAAFPAQKAARPRRALAAGLEFLEASAVPGWGVRGVRDWLAEHLVDPGHMRRPIVLTEPGAGSITLHESDAEALTSSANLSRLLAGARMRIISALRGLNASPTDDRFLSAAIFAGRVQRLRARSESHWVPQPEPTAPLSGIVLSLFAVDVLSHRDEYEKRLCICDICDRVTFQDGALQRKSCPDHLSHTSGFTLRVTPTEHESDA